MVLFFFNGFVLKVRPPLVLSSRGTPNSPENLWIRLPKKKKRINDKIKASHHHQAPKPNLNKLIKHPSQKITPTTRKKIQSISVFFKPQNPLKGRKLSQDGPLLVIVKSSSANSTYRDHLPQYTHLFVFGHLFRKTRTNFQI